MKEATKIEDGSPYVVESAGTAGTVSEREKKLLSMAFIGCDGEGRYVFRFNDNPLRSLVGDIEDFREWQAVQEKRARVIDAEKMQIERLLAQGREYAKTGDKKAFLRPVIVA